MLPRLYSGIRLYLSSRNSIAKTIVSKGKRIEKLDYYFIYYLFYGYRLPIHNRTWVKKCNCYPCPIVISINHRDFISAELNLK